jgi:hypothetical protein
MYVLIITQHLAFLQQIGMYKTMILRSKVNTGSLAIFSSSKSWEYNKKKKKSSLHVKYESPSQQYNH